ncbi:Transcriptional regulator containing an amidase domain and an AraC-type DNA-binding HTH domain [Collimonas arenae]|uniref:Transcriptional regulator containing an amidase domain and an AraC-type DNA-binding HTH domain n=2 Tax=Collimonas arenae TaxID=279058 RepID=A0A0A1FFB2_9BURK|nr:Transcriptional regulator containing an amidase domain and an AraC-type DNA-binding HTH domain [Collimonas arenae]
MGFASVLEPLRVANRFLGDRFSGVPYRWRILSVDGGPVLASNGMSINAEAAFDSVKQVDTLFIVAGFNPLAYYHPAIGAWLRKLDQSGATLGAIDTGCFLLAEAGLLQRQKITLHWEAAASFKERYPSLGMTVTQELFENEHRRLTCAGGTAGIDMMLDWIARQHGAELATAVSEQFVMSKIRRQSDHQRMQIGVRYGVHNLKTVQVISLMEMNLEEPLSTDQLAASIGVTRRQLERLFSTHLRVTPTHFYLGLRLEQARQLLQQSEMSITAVCVACGFESPSYFSRAYRNRFQRSPKQDRAAKHKSAQTVN